MVGPVRPQFVLFGSSVVQMSYNVGGWGAILADLYARKADILLRGYSGWNSRLALQYLDQVFPKDSAIQPSLVIVYFGGNDSMKRHPSGLGSHVPLPEYIENMKKIAFYLKSLSETTRLLFLTSPPASDSQIHKVFGNAFDDQARTNEASRIYAAALVGLCQELEVEVIDLWTAIQQRDDWEMTCFTDGMHLSSEGSKIVVKEILRVLKEAEWAPSLYWRSMPVEFPQESPYYVVSPDGKNTMNPSDAVHQWQLEWLYDDDDIKSRTKAKVGTTMMDEQEDKTTMHTSDTYKTVKKGNPTTMNASNAVSLWQFEGMNGQTLEALTTST